MTISSVDVSDVGIRVHIHESRPWGEPDENYVREIAYDEIDKLPRFQGLPEGSTASWYDSYEYYVEKVKRTLVFVFRMDREKSMGPNDEFYQGCYVKE